MAKFEFDTNSFFKSLDLTDRKTRNATMKGMKKVTRELVRISSEIAPFDKGTLMDSHSTKEEWQGNTIVGEVTYSIEEQNNSGNNFNYALWTHEMPPQSYGKGTKNRPGTTGWSGRGYRAGRKYLEKPLKGESDAFMEKIAETIRKELS